MENKCFFNFLLLNVDFFIKYYIQTHTNKSLYPLHSKFTLDYENIHFCKTYNTTSLEKYNNRTIYNMILAFNQNRFRHLKPSFSSLVSKASKSALGLRNILYGCHSCNLNTNTCFFFLIPLVLYTAQCRKREPRRW